MKFLYIFPLVGSNGVVKLERSYDTAEGLRMRASCAKDKEIIENLIKSNIIGSYNQLATGEFIFCTA